MRAFARSGLMALTALAAAPFATFGQTPPAAPPSSPATAKAAAAKTPANAAASQPVATVNGEVITRAQVIDLLSRYPIPAGNEEQVYRDAVDTIVNNRLISQFLNRLRFTVPTEKVDEQVAGLEKQLKQEGSDLATELVRGNKSLDEVRKEIGDRIRWIEFLNTKATDAELRKFVASHKDMFSGTQVKASHILVKVEPNASTADKDKVKQTLIDARRDIQANKTTFAAAANKFSEDPANADGGGGDIGYFTLSGGVIEEFANAAFGLKKGAISDPVETPYGFHLIQVTDRKEGKDIDFEQNKPYIKQLYGTELQKNLLTAERKAAKIDVKPMPADLFPPAATPATAPAATPKATTPKAAAPK